MIMNRKTFLIILDTWGAGHGGENDAIANCPIDMLVPNEADLFTFGL